MNIVITGASNGIGYHSSLALAAAGKHTVFALSRNKSKLEALREEALRRQSAGIIMPVATDLSDAGSVSKAVAEISSHARSLEVLVNNAGKLTNKPFDTLSMQEWKDVYEVNVFGTVEITRQLLPLLKAGSPAHIVNISSMGGVQGAQKFPGLSAYTSGKAALIGISECLAEEFKPFGIAVNCLALGSVATEMFSAAFPGLKAAVEADKMGQYIAGFALNGQGFYNGKVLQVSASTP